MVICDLNINCATEIREKSKLLRRDGSKEGVWRGLHLRHKIYKNVVLERTKTNS